jgi:DNA-binding transcriptional regulator YbjK
MSSHTKSRRSAILDAVIGLLAEKGLAGVTHRAADLAAGLPQGSSSYYFPKKSELVRAAASRLADELGKDCDDLQIAFAEVTATRGLEAAIAHAAQGLIASADRGKRLLLARIELTLAAARDDDLSDVGDELAAAARRPIEFFVGLISGGASAVPMETYVGLIDGIALTYATGQGPEPTADQVAAVLRSLTRDGRPATG